MTETDILHYLLLLIKCYFIFEKSKLKSVFILWSILRHLLLCVKSSVAAELGFSLEDSKRLDFMKYIFVCMFLEKTMFLHFTSKHPCFSDSGEI